MDKWRRISSCSVHHPHTTSMSWLLLPSTTLSTITTTTAADTLTPSPPRRVRGCSRRNHQQPVTTVPASSCKTSHLSHLSPPSPCPLTAPHPPTPPTAIDTSIHPLSVPPPPFPPSLFPFPKRVRFPSKHCTLPAQGKQERQTKSLKRGASIQDERDASSIFCQARSKG